MLKFGELIQIILNQCNKKMGDQNIIHIGTQLKSPYPLAWNELWASALLFTFCFLVRKMHHRIHALNTDIFQGELFCFYPCSECKMNASNALPTQRLDAPFLPSIVPVENRQHYAIWWPGANNENASPWLWEEKQLRG